MRLKTGFVVAFTSLAVGIGSAGYAWRTGIDVLDRSSGGVDLSQYFAAQIAGTTSPYLIGFGLVLLALCMHAWILSERRP